MMTNVYLAARTDPAETAKERASRLAVRGAIAAGLAAALAVGMTGTASAAPGETSGESTDAHVGVTSMIALTGLTDTFTLTGMPGDTATGISNVAFNVETNNLAGYVVTAEAAAGTLAATAPGNTDSIPIGALTVRQTGGTSYAALSSTTPVSVHTQATKSVEGGDPLFNDYQIVVPFVNADTYTATINYVATTL